MDTSKLATTPTKHYHLILFQQRASIGRGTVSEIQERLDEVCGLGWAVTYSPWGNDRIICHLTINGITRSSTGESDGQSERSEIGGTAAEAQAFKRACSAFGLGRYLYAIDAPWTEYDAERKQFTAQGLAKLAAIAASYYQRAQGKEAAQ